MNHIRKHDVDVDITINYLNQCVYKGVENPKGLTLKYRHWDIDSNDDLFEVYKRVKSLVRSGDGYIVGKVTPIDYFANSIEPLLKLKQDPIQDAVDKAIKQGIGTQKDYDEMIKVAKNPGRIMALHKKRRAKFNDTYKRISEEMDNE